MVGMVPRPLLLPVALVPLLFSPPHPTSQDPALEAQFGEISGSRTCQCGCNKMLSICDMQGCHPATPMRAEIKEKLAAGESKEAILAGFVDRYGLIVLSAPPATGFHLSAWIMPFVVLVVGAWIAKKVLGSWKRQTVRSDALAPGANSSAGH